MLSDLNYSELIQRMMVTFVEAFLGPLIGLNVLGDYNIDNWRLALAGGIGAVISFVYNVARELNTGGEV